MLYHCFEIFSRFLRAIPLKSELIIRDLIQGEQEGFTAEYINEVGLSSNVCICTEKRAYLCCLLNPPEFDSASAKDNAGLKHILGGRSGRGEDVVDQKFAELNKKFKNRYGNRWFWLSSLLLFGVGHFVSLLYIIFLLHSKFHILQTEIFLTYLTSGLLALCLLVYVMIIDHLKYKKVGAIIQEHFIDWKALGVRVKYHSMKDYHPTQNRTSSPHLKIWYKAGVDYESP